MSAPAEGAVNCGLVHVRGSNISSLRKSDSWLNFDQKQKSEGLADGASVKRSAAEVAIGTSFRRQL
ncbi:hypothetical protein MY4824_004807 [Beauveria thailandica]